MGHELPVQIIKGVDAAYHGGGSQWREGTNPLSDRLWNFGTAIYYKCGAKL